MKIASIIAGIALFASTAYSQSSKPVAVKAAATTEAASQVDPAKEADIRKLLELTGASNLATQAMDGMEQSIRPMLTNSLPPGEYREKLVELFFQKFHEKRDTKALVALIIPIYDKYYTSAELKGIIQFYESPVGKKMAASLPKIMAESQAVGGQWGEQLGRDCMMEVLQEHPELRQALESAKTNPQQ